MANWSNCRLTVLGTPRAVRSFSTAAGARVGRINTDESRVFLPSMEYGEGGDLVADPAQVLVRGVSVKRYHWQSRTSDELPHFSRMARKYPALAFILTEDDDWGARSWLLNNRGLREWTVPQETCDALGAQAMRDHGIRKPDGPRNVDRLYHAEAEALFKMMDVAEAHWTARATAWVRAHAGDPVQPGRR